MERVKRRRRIKKRRTNKFKSRKLILRSRFEILDIHCLQKIIKISYKIMNLLLFSNKNIKILKNQLINYFKNISELKNFRKNCTALMRVPMIIRKILVIHSFKNIAVNINKHVKPAR